MKVMLAAALLTLTSGAMAQGAERLDSNTPRAPASTPQIGTEIDSSGVPVTRDHAPEASPIGGSVPLSSGGIGGSVPRGTAVRFRLGATVSSGHARNGDTIYGTLASALRTASGAVLPAGTRVTGTVVSSAKAGVVQSGGVLSLQLTHIGALALVTDVAEFDGAEGHKDLPDSAPATGTQAVARAGSVLEFHVLENGAVPGIIPGAHVVSGGPSGAPAPANQPETTPNSQSRPNQQPDQQPIQQPINGGSKAPTTSAPGVPR